ncbi:uncharacterized protein [Dermacentor albipictus]|uniref:uncharacterized protein isoform X2 n=1 Tax=Dermacentor albipictus TaxID=60249 RepID=UPI0038FD11B6
MSYGSPCRCTCGALGNARSHSRPPPRQQRYSRIRISYAPGEQSTRVAASSPLGSRNLAEGVSVNDVDALIELLSSPPSLDSIADGGSDRQQQHQLTQATSIGCSPSSSNVIGRSSGTPFLTPRSTSNELSTSEQLVVQLFMDEVDIKEREIAAAALAAAAAVREQEERNSDVVATTAEDDSSWPTYCSAEAGHRGARSIGCGALAAPSTLALLLLAAVLVSNALLAVAYYEKRTWLCVTTVGLMHSPSLLFFVARVYSVAVLASIKEHFMRALVLIWYSVTLPLLHVLPLLTVPEIFEWRPLACDVSGETRYRLARSLTMGRQPDAVERPAVLLFLKCEPTDAAPVGIVSPNSAPPCERQQAQRWRLHWRTLPRIPAAAYTPLQTSGSCSAHLWLLDGGGPPPARGWILAVVRAVRQGDDGDGRPVGPATVHRPPGRRGLQRPDLGGRAACLPAGGAAAAPAALRRWRGPAAARRLARLHRRSADGIRAILRATDRLCGHLLQQVRGARPRRRRRDHGWVRHLRDHHDHHYRAAGVRRRHRHRLPAQVRRLAAHHGGAHRGRQLAAGYLLRAGRARLGAGSCARGPALVTGVSHALQCSQVLWRPGAGPHHACVCARLPRPEPRRASQHHVRCGLPVRHVL